MTHSQISAGMVRLMTALERIGDRDGTETQLNETAVCLAAMWSIMTWEQREKFLQDKIVTALVAKHAYKKERT